MERLLFAALLVANLVVFVYLCHLILVVKRSLIHNPQRIKMEERAEALQDALAQMVDDVESVAKESAQALDERQTRLMELAESCERSVLEACRLVDALKSRAREPRAEEGPKASASEGSSSGAEAPEAASEPEQGVAPQGARPEGEVRSAEPAADAGDSDGLTDFETRNRRVIDLQRAGRTNQEIAARLGVSVGEVELVSGLRKSRRPRSDQGSSQPGAAGTSDAEEDLVL